jgi:AtzE family amidohydrolase
MTARELAARDATQIARDIRAGLYPAAEVVAASLAAIAERNPALNCFTAVTSERALAAAARVDQCRTQGQESGLLAGVPFGVKNLFDVAGLATLAGSKIRRPAPPALTDASAVAALVAAGGALCGTLNMDEFAYGFVTENAHDGPTRNPHDLSRTAGGSSGGSAAAVAAGLLPLSLGSDTNGSVRVPASLCGIFGLKATYGRISRAGAFPFAGSLDHAGLFARSVRDLALGFDLLQGPDPRDPVCAGRAAQPVLPACTGKIDGLNVAILKGYFATNAQPEAAWAVDTVAKALGAARRVELPGTDLARAAAYIITAAEGGQLHLADLRSRAQDFDPATRDRLLAGALVPAAWVLQAQRFRSWFRARAGEVFAGTAGQGERVDVLLAPATPCSAPLLGQSTMQIAGQEMSVRANLGLFTQPISFIGLPVVCVPMWPSGQPGEGLPIGVQIIAAPGGEENALRVAAALEALGLSAAPPALG